MGATSDPLGIRCAEQRIAMASELLGAENLPYRQEKQM